jgi:hypothetical protein
MVLRIFLFGRRSCKQRTLFKYEMAYNEVSKEVIAEEHIVDEYEERFAKGDRTVRFYLISIISIY